MRSLAAKVHVSLRGVQRLMLMQDLRFALRQFRKSPGFGLTAVLMLALGIGASVAIFAFVDAALIKPLPYADPNRLVAPTETVATFGRANLSYQDYLDWKRMNKVFAFTGRIYRDGLSAAHADGNGAGAGGAGERWILSDAGGDAHAGP